MNKLINDLAGSPLICGAITILTLFLVFGMVVILFSAVSYRDEEELPE